MIQSGQNTSVSLFQPGVNCWKVTRAGRAAYLIDGEEYYATVKSALENAERSVLIVGWDIDSRMRLVRSEQGADPNARLGNLLGTIAEQKPELSIHVLIWDYAFIKIMERELWLSYKLGWKTHPNLHFRWDSEHPLGASHHQKIVVIDDQLAFSGGMDLSKWRWDSREHKADDPRRTDPLGKPYKPYHDIQLMVEGDTASALGDLARERWFRSSGERLPPVERKTEKKWPEGVDSHFNNIDIAIARTFPGYNQYSEIREVERLYLDAIQKAKTCIYIENQYTTSHSIAKALAKRLQEKDGPEVIVVTHIESGGWLEQNTMDVIRSRWIRILEEADLFNRFHIYYPHLPGYKKQELTVHSKVMIVDDVFLQIGSSNLCNRSMGLDTECDLALETGGDKQTEAAITRFGDRLIGEHHGMDASGFAGVREKHASLASAIRSLKDRPRSLKPLDGVVPDWRDRQVPHSSMIDPEKAVDSEWFRDQLVPEANKRNAFWSSLRFILMVLFLLAMAVAWRWTPLNQIANLDSLLAYLDTWKNDPLLPLLMVFGFVAGGCLGLPVTLMVTLMAIVFDPWKAFLFSYGSIMISSSLSFGIGHLVGTEFIQRYAGDKVRDVSQKIARQGVLFLALFRLLPIAPFTVINTVGGASHVKFRDFIIGTLIGSVPGAITVTLFVDRLTMAARDPRPKHFIIAAAIGVFFVVSTWLFGRWVCGRSRKQSEPGTNE